MKIANVKGMVAKGMILAFAAAALAIASPVKAEAQHFSIGVRVGDPYYAPRSDDYNREDRGERYARYEYARQIEFQRQQEFERRQAFYRHEQWERMHRDDRQDGYNGYRHDDGR